MRHSALKSLTRYSAKRFVGATRLEGILIIIEHFKKLVRVDVLFAMPCCDVSNGVPKTFIPLYQRPIAIEGEPLWPLSVYAH